MMKSNCLNLLVCFLALICLTAVSYGQDTWEKKPYQEWTKKEALQIVTESPWAQRPTLEFPSDNSFDTIKIPLATARLRSALPIRQALVRLKQLKVKYDKMTAIDKAKVDAEVKTLLDCSLCANFYVISLELRNVSDLKRFEKLSDEDRKNHIYLINDKSERRYLASMVREDPEIFLFFPRFDGQGNPLLTEEIKLFQVTIETKELFKGIYQVLTPGRFTFDVSRLTKGSEILF